MKPSQSRSGELWLQNFVPGDRPTATQILDSLTFVSETTFRATLTELLLSVIDHLPESEPVALMPIRNDYAIRTSEEPLLAPLRAAGSAYLMFNIAEEVAEARRHRGASLAPSVPEMRTSKVRHLLLVDDYLASGTSATRYLNLLRANPTLRSWHSYGLIRAHLAAYCISTDAQGQIRRDPWLDANRISAVSYGHDFQTAKWTPEELSAARKLCRDYSANAHSALGYGGSQGLIVFAHTVPNSLPAILWQRRSPHGPWNPFFAEDTRRMSPLQQVELGDFSPTSLDAYMAIAGEVALERAIELVADDLAVFLEAVEKGCSHSMAQQIQTGLTHYQLSTVSGLAESLGYISAAQTITSQGLSYLEGRSRHAEKTPSQDAFQPYYPTQLRGVADV